MTRALLIASAALNLILLAVIGERTLQPAPITASTGSEQPAAREPVALPETHASLAAASNFSAQDSTPSQLATSQETAASPQSSAEPATGVEDEPEPAKMPLVFAAPDPSLQLDENATARLELLRERFMTEIGGPNQNPTDPQYYDRWQKAQAEVDQQLKIDLGQELYNKLQMSAQRAQ